MLSPPSLGIYPADQVFSRGWLNLESPDAGVLCMETDFRATDGSAAVQEHTVFLPLQGAPKTILDAVGMGD